MGNPSKPEKDLKITTAPPTSGTNERNISGFLKKSTPIPPPAPPSNPGLHTEETFREELEVEEAIRDAALMRHDLRSQLTAAAGNTTILQRFVDKLKKEPTSEKQQQIIQAIENRIVAIQNAVEIATRTNETRLPTLEEVQLKIQEIDLKEAIEYVASCFSDAQIKITSLTDDPNILSDLGYIERIFSNLILNALKYAQSPIEITINKQDKNAIITIRDHGPGVEDPEKIFKYRNRGKNTENKEGEGIGLYSCKAACEILNGTITVSNNEHISGATFTVTIPIKPEGSEDDNLVF